MHFIIDRLRFTLLFTLISCGIASAQYNQESIYPDLEGDDLYQALVEEFKPYYILPYDMARDTLFKNVYNETDSLYCIYTRFSMYMDPNEDPTDAVFNNGKADGINTEHIYPRSKGAQYGNGKSDMHSLAPCKNNVNSDRSNYPFGEIPANHTENWYYKDKKQKTVPTTLIEEYARQRQGMFQPREAAKGEVARAMMYFYTMYRQEALDADPDFFNIQRVTFCEWHDKHPVDSLEYTRSNIIAAYQDGKANPFVLDCSIPARLYCSDVPQTCSPVSVSNADLSLYDVRIMGNPTSGDNINVKVESPEVGYWKVRLISPVGQLIYEESLMFPTEYHEWSLAGKNLPKGLYFLHFTYSKEPFGKSLQLPSRKLIIQ